MPPVRPHRATPRRALLALVTLLPLLSTTAAAQPAAPVEAISLLGDSLRRPALDSATLARHQAQYERALADARARPGDADAAIWVGRRLGYLGRHREAIAHFGEGSRQHPRDARFLRHRGHRWITVRQLDSAVADLTAAGRLVRGAPDEVEPDGLPNARGIPTSTLQSNVWYHLGLAHYLRGDFARALEAYREAMAVSTNPDMQVATAHWLYMTLRRLDRDQDAAAVLVPIRRDMEVIENGAYHRLLLLYKGELPADSLLAPATLADPAAPLDPAVGYGVGNWHLYHGRAAEARRVFERVLAGGQWGAFGYVAAEAELARLRGR
jgi:tetratricopeptide (TPR) repeat protein